MNENSTNPYQTPAAILNNPQSGGKIMNFKRFTAWGVFGLSLITMGVYPICWMYSRSLTVNENHNNKISMGLLHSLIAVTVLFSLRNRLQDIINVNQSPYSASLSGVLTFFLNCIYLQYKINEAIDGSQ